MFAKNERRYRHVGLLIVNENDRWFSIVYKDDRFVFGKSDRFYKHPTRFELLENDLRPFLYDYFLKRSLLKKTIVFEKKFVETYANDL